MTAAEAPIPSTGERRGASVTPLRPLPTIQDEEGPPPAALIRKLAADRLRDLRDDGVTVGYVARMYGVEREVLEETMVFLGLSTR